MQKKFHGRNVFAVFTPFLVTTALANAATPEDLDLYVRCSFYPQGTGCNLAYQRALHDTSPSAGSVRDAFEHYARYLKPQSSVLTEDDKYYLQQNGIRLVDLNDSDLAGLHNVINDPGLTKDRKSKNVEVNAFIARAVAAELYCGTNDCPKTDAQSPN